MAKIQNVTLPYEALETIKKDVSDFSNAENKLTFNGILNTIISKYSGKSKAACRKRKRYGSMRPVTA